MYHYPVSGIPVVLQVAWQPAPAHRRSPPAPAPSAAGALRGDPDAVGSGLLKDWEVKGRPPQHPSCLQPSCMASQRAPLTTASPTHKEAIASKVLTPKGSWQVPKSETWPNTLERTQCSWAASTTSAPSTLKQGWSVIVLKSFHQGLRATKMLTLLSHGVRLHVSHWTEEKKHYRRVQRKAPAPQGFTHWRSSVPTAHRTEVKKTFKESFSN